MLSIEQKSDFSKATGYWNGYETWDNVDPISVMCEVDDVVESRDTVQMFTNRWGSPDEVKDTPAGDLLVWKSIQTRKGARRGDLFVMEFGEFTASYFDGEA